jgi:hypothetical protein
MSRRADGSRLVMVRSQNGLVNAELAVGTPSWLNPVCRSDGDGRSEIAGSYHAARRHAAGVLQRRQQLVESPLPGFSNHVNGTPELGSVQARGRRRACVRLLVPDSVRLNQYHRAAQPLDGEMRWPAPCDRRDQGHFRRRWCRSVRYCGRAVLADCLRP